MRKVFVLLAVLAGSAGLGTPVPASAAVALDPALVQTVQYRTPGFYGHRGFGHRGFEHRRFRRHEAFRRHRAFRHYGFRSYGFHGRPGIFAGRRF